MEIVVKAKNENEENKVTQPDELFNRLYDKLGTRKKRNLQIIHNTCKTQYEIGSKDFSITTISKLVADKDGPAEQTLRNSSGAEYRALIDAWAEYANGFTKKNTLKKQERKAAKQTLDDDILAGITDSTTRALIGMILAENKSLKKKVEAFQSQTFYIDMSKNSGQNNNNVIETNSTNDSLPPAGLNLKFHDSELVALRDAISSEAMERKGLVKDKVGRIKIDDMELFKPGFVNAIKRILDNYDK